MTKWATEIDDPARIPEILSRAFHTACNGRPGPVVIALPEDMLRELTSVGDARPCRVAEPSVDPDDVRRLAELLDSAERPLLILGGSRWDQGSVDAIAGFAHAFALPAAVSFRRQSLFPATHASHVGDLGPGANPKLVAYARSADLILLLGTRFSELASQGYTIAGIPVAMQRIVHVHPGAEELGRVYAPELAINASPKAFARAVEGLAPGRAPDPSALEDLRAAYIEWSERPTDVPGAFNLGAAICALRERLPENAVICNGAGNYATWVHRFYRFRRFGTQLAPTSGSMGYGVPAAVAAARLDPSRPVIAFAGDGCFLMNGQEFATAIQHKLPIIVVVVDNGMYGTIRMHQEREYPGRVVMTGLTNPDFAAYARAFGGYGERVERTEDFVPAFERARQSGLPAILHCIADPEAITPGRTLSAIRQGAERARAAAS